MGKRSKNKGAHNSSDKPRGAATALLKRSELNRCVQELAFLTSVNYLEEKNTAATYSKTVDLLRKIIVLERELGAGAAVFSKTPRSKHFPDLIDWVKSNGGNVDAVSIAEFPEVDCGLRAEQPLEEGCLVCSIPRKVMMIVDTDPSTEFGCLMQSDTMLKHMTNIALVFFLLAEVSKGLDSFWVPYIQSLPRSYSTILHFSPDDMALLKGSPTQETAMSQNIHIARQYAYFYDMLLKSDNAVCARLRPIFSYELYRWAVSTVFTRQNLIPSVEDIEKKVPALIPVWDMCNHVYGPITTGYNQEADCCDSFAMSTLSKGEQILLSYGYRPNSEFFIHNALVPSENLLDYYRLHLGLARTDPLKQLRADLLGKLDLQCGGDFLLRVGPEPVDGDLLAFIRVFSMDQAGLEHWLESGRWNDLKCMDCAVDTQFEAKAWNFLATRITLLLSVYPKVFWDETNECVALIKKLVDSEKHILQSALDYARLKAEH